MKSLFLFLLTLLWISAPLAWGVETYSEAFSENVEQSNSPYSQLISIQAGPFRPGAISVSNGSYTFNYGTQSLDSYLVEGGWSSKLFSFLGQFYFEENLAFSNFSGTENQTSPTHAGGQSISLSLVGLDTRIMHAWDWFPWHAFIPFVDGGYQYSFYFQSGPTDLDSVRGGVGNPVAGIGFRLWLNRSSSISDDHVNRLASIPIFLTAKYNRIFSQNTTVNLDSSSVFAGLSMGL